MADCLTADQRAERFDLIVANPPYLSVEETAQSAVEVRDFEPTNALTAAEGGLADLRHIIAQAPAFLTAAGLLALMAQAGLHIPADRPETLLVAGAVSKRILDAGDEIATSSAGCPSRM